MSEPVSRALLLMVAMLVGQGRVGGWAGTLVAVPVSSFGSPSLLSFNHCIPFHLTHCPICRRLAALLVGGEVLDSAARLQHIRSAVDGCFASMLRYSSLCGKGQQQKQQPQQGGAGEDAASVPAGEAGTSGAGNGTTASQALPQQPLSVDSLRALLLQQVPMAVADLRKQHLEAAEPEQRRELAQRLLLELLLRFCICGYGAHTDLPARLASCLLPLACLLAGACVLVDHGVSCGFCRVLSVGRPAVQSPTLL